MLNAEREIDEKSKNPPSRKEFVFDVVGLLGPVAAWFGRFTTNSFVRGEGGVEAF